MNSYINVYVPNLPHRKDRRVHIEQQYAERAEFNLHIVTPLDGTTAANSLWLTFIECVKTAHQQGYDYFIFGEDDHTFTAHYDYSCLTEAISQALCLGADMLSGGMSWMDLPVQTPTRNLFLCDKFTGMQFTVIFKQAYTKILDACDAVDDVTDKYLSKILDCKLVMYPYISIQKEFGYSDVTASNNTKHRVESLFEKAEKTLQVVDKINAYFAESNGNETEVLSDDIISNFKISTHIIHMPERVDRQKLYESQFADRKEFEIVSIDACKHPIGAVGLWKSICMAISAAKKNNDDAVLLCEDDHVFTRHYTRESFVRKVYVAAENGADLLSGGIGGFGNALPVSNGLYWVDWLWCTQFIVIYSQSYDAILNAEFGEKDVADEFLSKILLNKMVIHPFVSEQLDFGYSDVTSSNNEKGKITRHFDDAKQRLQRITELNHSIIS